MSALQKMQTAFGFVPNCNRKVGLVSGKSLADWPTVGIAVFGLLCATIPMELSQLSFAFFGALTYLAIQGSKKVSHARLPQKKTKTSKVENRTVDKRSPTPSSTQWLHSSGKGGCYAQKHDPNMAGKHETWQPSAQPVVAPSFDASTFEAQVQEFVGQIAPSIDGDKMVQKLAAIAKRLLCDLFPNAEVAGFACGDVTRGSPFAVAIPEIDIILSAPPAMIAERLQNRTALPLPHAAKLAARTLQKSALRACTDDLVVTGGFRFRRSAFKGHEPKVVLVAPSCMGVHTDPIPLSFSVNTVTPFYTVALLTECGQIDIRAKELILLVRRWAKYRGISHAAKGHLSSYLWTLCTVYFLQVCNVDCGPLLPALGGFKWSSGLLRHEHHEHQQEKNGDVQLAEDNISCGQRVTHGEKITVAGLFKEFVSFYLHSFAWRKEAVSIRGGARAAPRLALRFHVVVNDEGVTEIAPCIEDPFDPNQNLSNHMTAVTIQRLREELARVEEVLAGDGSLAELLEPWTPKPSAASATGSDAEKA